MTLHRHRACRPNSYAEGAEPGSLKTSGRRSCAGAAFPPSSLPAAADSLPKKHSPISKQGAYHGMKSEDQFRRETIPLNDRPSRLIRHVDERLVSRCV